MQYLSYLSSLNDDDSQADEQLGLASEQGPQEGAVSQNSGTVLCSLFGGLVTI